VGRANQLRKRSGFELKTDMLETLRTMLADPELSEAWIA
jgi:hypothetical protein